MVMPEMVSKTEYDRAAEDLLGLAGVRAADVLDRDPRADRPLLELTVGPGYLRVPPRVLRSIANHDLGVRSIQPQGANGHLIVEVI